jgi:hypothetical protein
MKFDLTIDLLANLCMLTILYERYLRYEAWLIDWLLFDIQQAVFQLDLGREQVQQYINTI